MAQKLSIYRGKAYPFQYLHTDTAGDAVSLVGHTVYFTVKTAKWDDDATDTSAVIKKTVTSAEHTDAAGGISDFTLTDADTYITPGKYYFDVIVEDEATGLSDPPSLIGEVTILPTRTNRNVGNEV